MPSVTVLKDASPAQLEKAAATNHIGLFCFNAISMGDEVQKADGITWTYAGPNEQSVILFPSLEEDSAGARLDDIITYYRNHPPREAGCWSLDPPQPPDLGIRLLARGFQPGWRPCWMALDLTEAKFNYEAPEGLVVEPDNTTRLEDVKDLPYAFSREHLIVNTGLNHTHNLQWFVATLKGEVVGHCSLFLTEGPLGTAGVYHVGVVPQVRKRGIGKAIVLKACLYAKERRYQYAVLNATGRRMYEQIGFKWISYGWTWWLKNPLRLISDPPSKKEVAFAEAIGRGDRERLNDLGNSFGKKKIQKAMTNGMTLMQLAVHCLQPASAEWLIQHGVPIHPIEAWDLGWKNVAAKLLLKHQRQVNALYGDRRMTLLHAAAERNDVELVRLALSAKPDLSIKDAVYHSTAMDWAKYFGHEEIVRLIRAFGANGHKH